MNANSAKTSLGHSKIVQSRITFYEWICNHFVSRKHLKSQLRTTYNAISIKNTTSAKTSLGHSKIVKNRPIANNKLRVDMLSLFFKETFKNSSA